MIAAQQLKLSVPITAAGLTALALSPALHYPLLTFAAHGFFSRICHQDPARSFWIAGVPLAVCARCLGIYAGAALGAWTRVTPRTALAALLGASVLNLIDVLAEFAGVHGNLITSRFLLGVLLGASISAILTAVAKIDIAIDNVFSNR